jgi:hypothetical protein
MVNSSPAIGGGIFGGPMYEVPTPEEIKIFMDENGLTGADMAAMTGVKPRAARRWVAPVGQKGARPIPWAAWVLIQILTGQVKRTNLLKLIGKWKNEEMGLGLFERGKAGRPPKERNEE